MVTPSDPGEDLGRPGGEPRVGVPRWVKGFVLAAVLLLALLVVVMLLSGGEHGPGRHFSSTSQPGHPVATSGWSRSNLEQP